MIWYFYILWNNHYNKRSYHSSPYKAVTIYLTLCMLHSSICITCFHLCTYTSSLWACFMCPYVRSVSLPQFLSHHNKNLERWKGFRTTKKLQLRYFIKQSLPRHRRMPTPKESSSHSFLVSTPDVYTSHFLLWLCLVQNRASIYHQSMKGNANGLMLKADWQLQVI